MMVLGELSVCGAGNRLPESLPGGSLQFAFEVFSLAGEIEKVEFVVEARP